MKAQDNEFRHQNTLAAHLDALIAGRETDLFYSDVSGEVRDLMNLAAQLQNALVPVEPSAEFINRLRVEFVNEHPNVLLLRWRKLPPRYQVAAKVGGATLTAGLFLLAVRRAFTVLSIVRSRHHEEGAALAVHSVS